MTSGFHACCPAMHRRKPTAPFNCWHTLLHMCLVVSGILCACGMHYSETVTNRRRSRLRFVCPLSAPPALSACVHITAPKVLCAMWLWLLHLLL